MRYLSKEKYIDKMHGAWLGKAIGGTLGAPFEPTRAAFDVDFYTTDLRDGMLPNDDLDLQLVWLNAAERYGISLTAERLAEYWMLGIVPNWAEYGVAKSNLRLGISAPASGGYRNRYKDSNGAWIRSEIWACLAPGHPEIATKLAYEDASVDHADEGVYAEIFMAALQSAAFVLDDRRQLIDIALSYIPSDCACAKAVRTLIDLHASGIDWKSARHALLKAHPGSFGAQLELIHAFGGSLGDVPHRIDADLPNADWGMDAPSNVALTLMGWLYAGDDFGRALCITTGCGEDADCTAGTLGAILGILMGASAIPERWSAPIGNRIVTKCVSELAESIRLPATIDDLVARTASLMPAFLHRYVRLTAPDSELIAVDEPDRLVCQPLAVIDETNGIERRYFRDSIPCAPCFRGESALLRVTVTAPKGIELTREQPLPLQLSLENSSGYMGVPMHVNVRWLLPDGIRVDGGAEYSVFVNQHHCGVGRSRHTVTVCVDSPTTPLVNVVCELTVTGFPTKIYVPVTLVTAR